MTKVCSACKATKPITDFFKDKAKSDGAASTCKPCAARRVAAWKSRNPARAKALARAIARRYRTKHPEKVKAGLKAWREANPHKVRAYSSWYSEAHRADIMHRQSVGKKKRRAYYNAKEMERYAQKVQVTPAWASTFIMEESYALAKLRSERTGIEWQVDHIVPIRSSLVCGLHTHDNLRVIPAVENRKKGNRYWPDMPVAGE